MTAQIMPRSWLPAILVLLAVVSANGQSPANTGRQDMVNPAEFPATSALGDDSTGGGVKSGGPPSQPLPAAGTLQYIPLTNRQKADRTVGRLVRPTWLVFAGLSAGYSQWKHRPAQWGQGSEGYARRFGTIYALAGFRQSVLYAGSALNHEDVRYPRSERHRFFPRMRDALKQAMLSRRDDGSLGFASARTVSDLGTTMLTLAVYPDERPFTGRSMLHVAGIYLAVREAYSVVREFTPDVVKALHLDGPMKRIERP